jgi:hypothetical protein
MVVADLTGNHKLENDPGLKPGARHQLVAGRTQALVSSGP